MRNAFLGAAAAGALCLVSASPALAAGYMKIGDIKGESTDEAHKDWINLLSVSSSIARSAAATARVAPRGPGRLRSARPGELFVVKQMDASSPKLQEALAKGTFFAEVEIHFQSTGDNEPYFTIKLENARISSVNPSSPSSSTPRESFSLNYEEIVVTYSSSAARRSKGKVEYTWKVEEGEK